MSIRPPNNSRTRPHRFGRPLASARSRIIFGFALLMFAFVFTISASAWMAWDHDRTLARAEENSYTITHLKNARLQGGLGYSHMQAFVLAGNENVIPQLRQAQSNAIAELTLVAEHVAKYGDEGQRSDYRALLSATAPLATLYDDVIGMRGAGDVSGATERLTSATPTLLEASAIYDRFEADELSQEASLRARADRTAELTIIFLISSGAIGLVIGAAAALMVMRSIFRPLRELETAAHSIVEGDLAARAPETGPTEFARLGAGFNQMTEALLDASKRRQLEEERERAYAQLAESEERWRGLVQNGSDIICVVRPDSEIVYISPAIERITGRKPEELVGVKALQQIHPEDVSGLREALESVLAGGDPAQAEVRVQRADGAWCYLEARGAQLKDGSEDLIVINARDVTERREAQDTITHMAYHDALTGLPNRLLLEDRFEQALARARRSDQKIGVISVDLDRFKIINDTLGHAAGDSLLEVAAKRLQLTVRDGDTVARIGGDEFLVLLDGCDGIETTTEVAVRIVDAFRQPFSIGESNYHATVSAGLAIYPDDGLDAQTLMSKADVAMYAVKDGGRDGYRQYTPDIDTRGAGWLSLETELRRALINDEIEVYYQPQVDVDTSEIVGVEALARWRHPSRGIVEPAEFIPLAEETGLIIPLGEHVLRTACEQAVAWSLAGLAPIQLAVNVSLRQFSERSFPEVVARALHDSGLEAPRLELEITETTALKNLESTRAVAAKINEMGVRLSIDDFGTGNTALRYLKDFPIQTLKIDQSFIQSLADDPSSAAIATSIISLAHRLDLNVIAEGVETREQLTFLRQQHCDAFQGFICSRPLPADEVSVLLRSPTAAPARG